MSLDLLRQLKSLTARLTHWHLRWLKRLVLTCGLLLSLCALLWQFWLVPRLNDYKPWLEQMLSQRIGAPVRIAKLSGGWEGIRPQLALQRFQLLNAQQHAALEFSNMEGSLSWWHLLLGQLNFSHLHLQAPQLDIVRLKNRQWQIAGITLAGGQHSDGQLLNWLLEQGELTISRGILRLEDQRGEFPALSADNVQLNVQNWFSRHKLLLKFSPTQLAGSPVELSANLSGSDVNQLAQWSGWLKFELPRANLSHAAPWLSPLLPQLQVRSGIGALALKLELADGKLEGVASDLKLTQWRLKLANQPELDLPLFNGRIIWQDRDQLRTLQILAEQIDGAGQTLCRNCELEYLQTAQSQTLTARNWSLAGLNAYSVFFPASLSQYRHAQLGGTLEKFSVEWPGRWPLEPNAPLPAVRDLKVELETSQFALKNAPAWPEVAGIDIDLQFEPRGGRLKLLGQNAQFNYPAQFLEPMQFSRLQTQVDWQREGKGWALNIDGFKAVSDELDLAAEGRYSWPGQGMGQVDVSANINRLAANRVFAYLPRVLSDDVLIWLKTSLLAGEAQKGQLIWRGDVAQFPYTLGTPAAKAGQFMVKTQAANVTINYGDDWPVITKVDGQVLIDGMQLTVDAQRGDITGTAFDKVKVTIPNLEQQQHVLVDGRLKGKTADFLYFVQHSPVRQATHGFLNELKSEGSGELALQLDIPIEDIEQTRIKGQFAFTGNQLNFGATIPVLTQAKGAVSFTESSMKVLPSTAKALGGSVIIQGQTDAKGELLLSLKGQAELAQTLQYYAPPLSSWLQGSVPFQANLQVDEDSYALNLSSELQGGIVNLPAPLGKTAQQTRPFRLKVSREHALPRLDLSYGKALQAALLLSSEPAALRGKVLLANETSATVLSQLTLDGKGIQIGGQWSQLNLNDWLPMLSVAQPSGKSVAKTIPQIVIDQLGFDQVNVAGKVLSDVVVSGQLSDKGLQASLSSQQIAGDVQWQIANNRIHAQLQKLWLPLKNASTANNALDKKGKFLPRGPLAEPAKEELEDWLNWPALHLVANDFRFKSIELGTLTLQSKPQNRGIDFDELSLRNPDGQITFEGQWFKQDFSERTQAKVRVESPNLGKLLKRLGYPEAMKQAPLHFYGDGQWQGAPWSPEWNTLNGKMDLTIGAGQFTKLEPGVGRFISILSLQALPRRLKLDFSDVFSAGFEFDEISGSATIEQGVARTNNLKINGPAAKVRFSGDANFVAGTQHLRVRIVPSIGGAVALGVGVLNPLAGLATLAVQSVMDNPLGELVAYEFQIDGSMSDPQIKKIGVKPESPRLN
ncbi:TIGR02099 family protein [Chitinibacter fontanus]|uniref:TIGR02099 family protein n=1 Tax=Chitinibacter fontanus TaxID=1737446 RepID=A0A7D5V823_9NEIS|nr:YhdP family protein [Chitinibacter fontanus]QLI80354.1 TIGR02099 family protein [Chitinibacter fontanus]